MKKIFLLFILFSFETSHANLSCFDYLKDFFQTQEVPSEAFLKEKLSDEDIRIIYEYVDGFKGYTHINESLRSSKQGSHCPKCQALIDSLSKIPNFEGKVYRAIQLQILGKKMKKHLLNLKVGDLYSDLAPMSSSRSRRVTNGFRFQDPDLSLLLVINSRTGKSIESISPLKKEKEVIFLPGTIFKITKVERDRRGSLVISMDELKKL